MGNSVKTAVINTFKDPISRLVWFLLLILLVALGGYWWWLLNEHNNQLSYAESQLQLRAEQTSNALASQAGILISNIDYLSNNLSELYVAGDPGLFRTAASEVFNVYEKNPVIQVAVADARGQIIFSQLGPDFASSGETKPVSIVEREHFLVHRRAGINTQDLYISNPVYGRISKKWSIQFSRGLWRGEEFVGVLVVSVSPSFISDYFLEVFPRERDVAVLLNERGRFLARSSEQEQFMGRSVSRELQSAIATSAIRGHYRLTTEADGGREYGWRRVSGYPLIVSIGLDREVALSPVNQRLLSNWYWNLVSTTVILLSLLFIGLLISHARRQQKDVIANRKRLTDLVAQTPGAVYQLIRHRSGDYKITYISPGITALLGLNPAEVKTQLQSVFRLIHPQDVPSVSAELEKSAETLQRWDRMFRVCLDSGETRWLSVYAKPQRREDGSTLWNGYLHDVTQAHHDTDALKTSEERLRITIDAVNDGLWEWDLGTDSVRVDERCLVIIGPPRPWLFPIGMTKSIMTTGTN